MSIEPSAADISYPETEDRDLDKILGALRGKPDGMTRHQIRRSLFHGNKPAESIACMLATLERRNLVRSERIGTGGRPAERWYGISAESRPAESRPAAVCPPLPSDPAPVAGFVTTDPPPDAPPVEPEPDPLPPRVHRHTSPPIDYSGDWERQVLARIARTRGVADSAESW
jgi:hypothetical protein